MDKKISSIKERVIEIAEFKSISKEKFINDLGMTYGNFKGIQKKTSLNSDFLDRILSIYPELSAEWLLTGKGAMLKISREVPEASGKAVSNPKGIPLLPMEAFAGLGDNGVAGVPFDVIEERYEVPLFKQVKVDFMLPVRGSSMYPKYSSGDVVACRLITELLFVQWNKVYVIDSISQGVIMKRLKKSTLDDNVVCKSDNKDYDEFEIPRSDIRNIALVVGVIRLE